MGRVDGGQVVTSPLDEPSDDARVELREAVRVTLATGSARVRQAMEANPPEHADYEEGEGIADFREGKARVRHTGGRFYESWGTGIDQVAEWVTDRDTTYFRIGGPEGEWHALTAAILERSATSQDGLGELDGLDAAMDVAKDVVRVATRERFDGEPARRYATDIPPPKSMLRDALILGTGALGPTRFWLDVWTDARGRVRRIVTCNRPVKPDGALPLGAVRTTTEFSEFGLPVQIATPPTD